MTAEFIHRIRKEFTLKLTALEEIVLALSDRVNRKVQALKYHWHAAALTAEIDTLQREVGARLAPHLDHERMPLRDETFLRDTDAHLSETGSRIRLLKQELGRIDALIHELETELLHADLLQIQRDLSARSATMERLAIARGAPAVGRAASRLDLPPDVRLVLIFRGPTVLTPDDAAVLRADDIVLLAGPRHEVHRAHPLFHGGTPRAMAS
jgi:hypothetical protein